MAFISHPTSEGSFSQKHKPTWLIRDHRHWLLWLSLSRHSRNHFFNISHLPLRPQNGFFCATHRASVASTLASEVPKEDFCHSLQFNCFLFKLCWNIELMESDADKSWRRLMNNFTFCLLYSSPLHYSVSVSKWTFRCSCQVLCKNRKSHFSVIQRTKVNIKYILGRSFLSSYGVHIMYVISFRIYSIQILIRINKMFSFYHKALKC